MTTTLAPPQLTIRLKNNIWMHAGIMIIYYLLFQSFYNLIDSRSLWPYANMQQCMIYFLLNFIPITIVYATNYLIIFNLDTFRTPLKRLSFDIVSSFVSMSVINIAFSLALSFISKEYMNVNWAGTVFNNIFLLLGLEVAYFVKNYIRQIKQISENRQKTLQYQYDALRAQVNPHFLFNTLNILYALVGKDAEKSKQFILSLSRIYRYVLDQQGREKVTLDDELKFVKEYSKILTLRYSKNFTAEIGEPPEKQHYVVPFTLQLLIENIVKHNKVSNTAQMKAKIGFTDSYLTVSNNVNIKPAAQATSTHKGLSYLKMLYGAYGKEIEIKNENNTFMVKIPYLN